MVTPATPSSARSRSTKWLPMNPAPPTIRYRSLTGRSPPPTPTCGSRCRAGWLTSRCQITAARPSVWGVIRSATSGGMTTHEVADAAV